MEEHELLQSILDAIPDPVVAYDVQGRVIYLNPAFTRVFGWTLDELRGRPLDYIPAEQQGYCREKFTELRAHRGRVRFESRRLTKDGREVEVALSTALFRLPGGGEGIIVVLKVITEQRRREALLLQAQKMEALGTLAAGIAHDFNNILGTIIGYLELVLMEELPLRQRELLEKAVLASQRAKDLIQQILSFARQNEYDPKPIYLGPLIRETVELLRASIPSTIQFRLDLEEETAPVWADATQIQQVIINLCTNAAQAIGEGKTGLIQIALRQVTVDRPVIHEHFQLSPGHYHRLSVRDTGAGMDRQTLSRIFDPFFTTKTRQEGTGMGLAIVHGIVSRHGGAISVYSEPGKGAVFNVYLPSDVSAAGKREEGEEPLALPGGGDHPARGHILVVDDEPALVELLAQALQRSGYRVSAFHSSREALEALRADPQGFDLVISDMTMPQMTGLELAGEIKRLRPELPVILTSGFYTGLQELAQTESGVDLVISKPFTLREVVREAGRLVGSRGAGGASRSG